jgi:hypothetical protein
LSSSTLLNQYKYQEATSSADRTVLRNEVIAERSTAYDLVFEDFAVKAWEADAGASTVADWIVLGLTAAGSLASAGTTQALSAAAAGVTGAKTSLQKNFLRKLRVLAALRGLRGAM